MYIIHIHFAFHPYIYIYNVHMCILYIYTLQVEGKVMVLGLIPYMPAALSGVIKVCMCVYVSVCMSMCPS